MSSTQVAPLLSISGLTKRFGVVTALWNVDLSILPGDFVAIFGPNGAGKSTLLQLVAQLSKPSEGSIEFPEAADSGREEVGYVSHMSLLYNDLTGFENLVFFARLYGIEKPVERANELLEKMNLKQARNQFAGSYSSGMKQRLKIARAMLHEPRLLLLDEPYAGLDQHGSRLLTGLLKQLREEQRTVLLITHNLGEGLDLSSRIVIMNRGQVVYRAARDEVDETGFESLYFRTVEG